MACFAALASAPLAATTDDRDDIVLALVEQDRAVMAIGERLSVASRDWCPAKGWATGMVVQTYSQYGADFRTAAARVLGAGAYPVVAAMLPDGAAARAGIRVRDQIVAVDGRPLTLSATKGGAATMVDTERALAVLDAGLADGVADLSILRAGVPVTARLVGTPACRVRFEVAAGGDGNASATDSLVQISSDLVATQSGEAELAPLIAHELAHVVLRHETTLAHHWRGALPGFGKGGAAIRASELAADRLSIYLLALAGFRASDAVSFWTRFGQKTDYGILSDRTHPRWQQRVAAIGREVARVERQRRTGEPIRPPAELGIIPSE